MDKKLNNFETFVFDLDGTLLNSKKEILPSSLSKIAWLQKKKKNIIIATGRPYYRIKKQIAQLNLELPVIAGNGSTIYDHKNKKILFFQAIKKEIVKQLVDFFKQHQIDYLAYAKNEMLGKNFHNSQWFDKVIYSALSNKNPYRWAYSEEVDLTKDFNKYEIGKILVITEFIKPSILENLKQLINQHTQNIYYVQSQEGVLDIMSVGISKGITLKHLINDILHFDIKKTLVFGDADNDVSMFKEAAYSVAMANATEKLKANAKYITKSNDEDGIAHFIDLLG